MNAAQRIGGCAALVIAAVAGCHGTPRVLAPPDATERRALARPVALVVLPAVDQRPRRELDGASLPPTFAFVTDGGGVAYTSGVAVIADGSELEWTRNSYRQRPTSASTTVSSDLAMALSRAFDASVSLDSSARTVDQVPRLANGRYPEGTIVILPVIDHLTRVTPGSNQSVSSTSRQQVGNAVYETTRSAVISQVSQEHWVTMIRLHLFELRGGGVARHVVRYAARSGSDQQVYPQAILEATRQVGVVIDRELGDGELPPNATVAPPPAPAPPPPEPSPVPASPETVPPEPAPPATS